MLETRGKGIVDTGCTRTVSGENWYRFYFSRLDSETQIVIRRQSNAAIVFGDGKKVKAEFQAIIPMNFGSDCVMLTCDVIRGDLPLLISVHTITKAKFVIDFDAETYKTLGQSESHRYGKCSTGHITIDVIPSHSTESLTLVTLTSKEIQKLHSQFGHCSAVKLADLINSSSKCSVTIQDVKSALEKCGVCARYGRVNVIPKVSLPLASDFNHCVSIDLHHLTELGKSVYFVHLIDVCTRFSAACIIHDKTPETIVEKVFFLWVCRYGPPRKFLTDNGGEFSNHVFHTMCEQLGTQVQTTAAESPFSNGICERHNQTLNHMFLKLREDYPRVSTSILLEQAVFAKNCLVNSNGFSPYQLVYGRNPNIPTMLNATPANHELRTTSDLVRQQIESISGARQAFMACENDERIKRAMKHQFTPDNGPFVCGQTVYYKREGDTKWHGPGRVIGEDGRLIIVRNGGYVIRAHAVKVRLAGDEIVHDHPTKARKSAHSVEESHILVE